MLISAVMPIMSLYRLPHGQYGYSGHVVNLPHDVASFTQLLPRLPANLDVLIVRREGANQTHRDFRVRRSVVLQWLVTHNQYYCSLGITIDPTTLDQLPEDGNVPDVLSVTDNCSSPDIPSTSTPPTTDTDGLGDHLPQSFVPTAAPSMTQQEAVQQSVEQQQSTSSFNTSDVAFCWRNPTKRVHH